MVRRVSKTQEETEMARRGENIHKRKDGRWEGRYIKARTPEGKIQWGYVYGMVYAEVKRVLIQKKAEAGFYNLKRTDLTFFLPESNVAALHWFAAECPYGLWVAHRSEGQRMAHHVQTLWWLQKPC